MFSIGADSTGATGNFAPVLTQEPGQTLRFAPVPFMAVLWFFKWTLQLYLLNLTKGAKFASSVGHPITKMLSASGGLGPWPPDQGLCPWTPLGAPPPNPHIRSRSRARHILSVPVLFLTGNEPWFFFFLSMGITHYTCVTCTSSFSPQSKLLTNSAQRFSQNRPTYHWTSLIHQHTKLRQNAT